MKIIIPAPLLLLLSFGIHAQTNIPLTAQLSDSKLEYSGICKSGSRIMLLPQYPEKGLIYGLDSINILAFLTNRSPYTPSVHKWKVKGLDDIRKRIKGYEGFEAATQNREFLYCTIETDANNDSCYLIRGLVKEDTIDFDLKSLMPLLKRKRDKLGYKIAIDNAGFESLTYIPTEEKLLALFEYNNYPQRSMAFMIDLDFNRIDTIELQSIDFRLTDICVGNDDRVYAINHHYRGDYAAYEPDTLISSNGKALNWTIDNYTSILRLDWKEKGYITTPICTISPEGDNWEGIIPFYEGFLLVTDEFPTSKLVYYPVDTFKKSKKKND